MPQPRKYATRARTAGGLSQRRDRLGSGAACSERFAALTGDPDDAGQRSLERDDRAGAVCFLRGGSVEMQSYHDDRSEQWQESTKAEELLAKLEHLQETMDQLQGIE